MITNTNDGDNTPIIYPKGSSDTPLHKPAHNLTAPSISDTRRRTQHILTSTLYQDNANLPVNDIEKEPDQDMNDTIPKEIPTHTDTEIPYTRNISRNAVLIQSLVVKCNQDQEKTTIPIQCYTADMINVTGTTSVISMQPFFNRNTSTDKVSHTSKVISENNANPESSDSTPHTLSKVVLKQQSNELTTTASLNNTTPSQSTCKAPFTIQMSNLPASIKTNKDGSKYVLSPPPHVDNTTRLPLNMGKPYSYVDT